MYTRFFFIFIAVFGITSCSRGEEKGVVKAWVYTQRTETTDLVLYVNDTARGTIPKLGRGITCNDADSIKSKSLGIDLRPGKLHIQVKTNAGKLVASGLMNLQEEQMDFKGESGGMDARQTDNCMTIEVL
ncbi:MAG: hypothetical protein JNL57_13975 [Bacteroidetes bacterium]|nr:hypothetical protein [Bacteroidota bacterium]